MKASSRPDRLHLERHEPTKNSRVRSDIGLEEDERWDEVRILAKKALGQL